MSYTSKHVGEYAVDQISRAAVNRDSLGSTARDICRKREAQERWKPGCCHERRTFIGGTTGAALLRREGEVRRIVGLTSLFGVLQSGGGWWCFHRQNAYKEEGGAFQRVEQRDGS